MLITLQKNDPRLGVLTHEGQYRWPAVNIANLGYQIPNVQPYYVDEKPDDRGSRWFVILCPGYFDAEVHVGDLTTAPVSTLAALEVGIDVAMPDSEKTVLTVTDSNGYVETHEVTFDTEQPAAIEPTNDPRVVGGGAAIPDDAATEIKAEVKRRKGKGK